uniref:Histidine--tRNA ligase, chloroplastic n=1 Tax=Compsopogon caeruleus TaxID=31354 RepID=A0A1Z1XB20_9RHOD|nr:histidine--tRNA ligase [Compsopogon caeruleus]ARX96060.1 histidine--tRNA ligase [Compsopogon caeruleus]
MMEIIKTLRGTYDITASEINYWHYIESEIIKLFEQVDYTEIRTPIIEFQELFLRGVGQGTDIVSKEMYSFKDKNNRYISLRPEGTAGIARSFIENKMYAINKIHKLWYKGPMFRYERPQQGRQRQFTQIGIELLGVRDPRADAEVISIAYNLLNRLSIKNFILEINSIGSSNDRINYQENLINYLNKYNADLDEDSKLKLQLNPLRILDTKNEKIKEILYYAPSIQDFLSDESRTHFTNLEEYLNIMLIPYRINLQLVRGLDYYNDTAFEFKANQLGAQDTICGGGRYDSLIEKLGGPSTPAIGWAIGMERILNIIKNNITLQENYIDFYIISDNFAQSQKESIKLFSQLIKNNYKIEIDLTNDQLQKKLKKANKKNAQFCIIINSSDLDNNQIIKKNMITGEQEIIHRNSIM